MSPFNVCKQNIWQYKQNIPSLIAKDFELYFQIPQKKSGQILMARGIFKWLACRRDLIKTKSIWKDRITKTIQLIKMAKKDNPNQLYWLRGYLKAYEEARKEIKDICHSERWRIPDNERCQEVLKGLL